MKRHTATCEDCGWTSNPARSPNQAAYALRLHSCDRHRAKAAAAQRGRDRAAAVDRTPKPCEHQAGHQHGTYVAYVLDRCRCAPCTTANTAYERNRHRQTGYGRWAPYVDAEPARRHVRELQAAGMGLKQIVTATGGEFSQGAMTRLMYGMRDSAPSKRIRAHHADAILAVQATVDTLAGGARVPSVGTNRRLQALVAIGYSQSRLAREIGTTVRNFNYLLHGGRQVTARRHRDVAELYQRLSGTTPSPTNRWEQGSVTLALNYAARNGFHPPIAWDDDALDSPEAQPFTAAPADRAQRRINLVEDVEFLLSLDPFTTTRELTERFGYRDPSGIQNTLSRAGRDDLLTQLARNTQLTA